MYIPHSVLELMERLEDRGHECWAVGGCVRDHYMGIVPHDYDCCTGATPEQMQEIFSDRQLVLAGLKHGTVGVVTKDGVVEITTFRTEGDYSDARHPGWVRFVRDIREDLARRDFTVNAMAFSPRRGLCDPFGGREDLGRKVIRAVGNAETRFEEDALRILRGLRLAAQLEFDLHPATAAAIHAHAADLHGHHHAALGTHRRAKPILRLPAQIAAEPLQRRRQLIGSHGDERVVIGHVRPLGAVHSQQIGHGRPPHRHCILCSVILDV